MPEGDTIYRSARTLHRALAGQMVVAFHSVFPALERVHHDTPLTGRTIEQVYPRGKHLLVRFEGAIELRTHMRMRGSWHIYRPGEPWQLAASRMRLRIDTAPFVAVAFDVHDAEFIRTDAPLRSRRSAPGVEALGPDLLAADFGPPQLDEALRRLLADPERRLGEALLDQRNVAGIGNQYRSELLFLAGVDPRRSVGSVPRHALRSVLERARALLQVNTLADTPDRPVAYRGLRRTTGRQDPRARLWVYGRAGRPCRRCGAAIAQGRSGPDARVVFWCPRCQPPQAPEPAPEPVPEPVPAPKPAGSSSS